MPGSMHKPSSMLKPLRQHMHDSCIRLQAPDVHVHEVSMNSVVSSDWHEDRVRVWVNSEHKVVKPPMRG